MVAREENRRYSRPMASTKSAAHDNDTDDPVDRLVAELRKHVDRDKMIQYTLGFNDIDDAVRVSEHRIEIPVAPGEEILIVVSNSGWTYEITWVHSIPETSDTKPGWRHSDLAEVDDPELAAAVILAAIAKYRREPGA